MDLPEHRYPHYGRLTRRADDEDGPAMVDPCDERDDGPDEED